MNNEETEKRLENIENLLLRLNSALEHVHDIDHCEGENGHYFKKKSLLRRLPDKN